MIAQQAVLHSNRVQARGKARKHNPHPSYADNIIVFGGKYLPVEVKLDISAEADLKKQVRKYCNCDVTYLDQYKKRIAPQEKVISNRVLIIDTFSVFLYDNDTDSISELCNLNTIKQNGDIIRLRDKLMSKVFE